MLYKIKFNYYFCKKKSKYPLCVNIHLYIFAMKIHELERKLKEAGCYFIMRCYFIMHGKRHDHWYSPITEKTFPIPRHGAKEIPKGTLSAIEKESGVCL